MPETNNVPPITLHRIAAGEDLTGLFKHEPLELNHNWDGSKSTLSAQAWLFMSEDRLYFGAQVSQPAWCDTHLHRGDYVEGLWQRDVAELFIAADDASYQEFNLSPTGAWWSMSFTSPRVRTTELFVPPKNIKTYGHIKNHSWRAAFSIPVNELAVDLNVPGKTRANVSIIVGENPRTYLSHAKLPGNGPDFHQPGAFNSLRQNERFTRE